MNDSTSPKPRPFETRLRHLHYAAELGKEASPDVATVLSALRSGDEVLVRRLAELVESQRERIAKDDHLGVRKSWLAALAEWDPSRESAASIADRFTAAMHAYLRDVQPPDGEVHPDPRRVVECVATAFEVARAGGADADELLRAGLRALGVPWKRAEALADFDRK